MFGVPGESFVDSWVSFLVLVPIIIIVVLIVSKFSKTKAGKYMGKFFHKLLLVVTYPFYKIRSMLSDRGKSIFDGFFYAMYCAGAILLIMYAAN